MSIALLLTNLFDGPDVSVPHQFDAARAQGGSFAEHASDDDTPGSCGGCFEGVSVTVPVREKLIIKKTLHAPRLVGPRRVKGL
jgi:hypothetical protein